jgi:hypothetical protein
MYGFDKEMRVSHMYSIPKFYGSFFKSKLNTMSEKSKAAARNLPDSDYIPSIGEKFTVSNNLVTGNRSYTNEVITCTGTNESHVQGLVSSALPDQEKKKFLFDKSEHKFYPAEDL